MEVAVVMEAASVAAVASMEAALAAVMLGLRLLLHQQLRSCNSNNSPSNDRSMQLLETARKELRKGLPNLKAHER